MIQIPWDRWAREYKVLVIQRHMEAEPPVPVDPPFGHPARTKPKRSEWSYY